MPIQQTCTVAGISKLNDYAWHMVLEAGRMAGKIRPGQFLHIKCGHSRLLRRPISICEWSGDEPDDLVSVVFEVRGDGTQWLSRRKTGDRLDVLGPLGNGFDIRPQGRYLLVGGGIGVSPIVGCRHSQEDVAVVGFRSIDRVTPALIDKLEDTCASVYFCTDDGTLGRHGFVDGQVRDILAKDKSFTAILACGPRPMLSSVVKAAAEFGVPCQVSMEERMACGVGACLGCAIQMRDGTMKHVCKDGPVFNAEEVDWDV